LDNAVKELVKDPLLGDQKRGDLAFLRVYKFKMIKQLTLLGYSYDEGVLTLELMALGSHENFYRDIKRTF
ncbi:addiction module toxin RelE, partial [Oleiphilus sp. HI0072]